MDLSTFAQAVSGLNSATALVKTLIGLRDEAQRLATGNEALTQIFEANSKLLALQVAEAQRTAEHEAVLREKRELEEKIRNLEEEKADFERYALHEISPGVFTYALRESHRNGEPMHQICPACRSTGKKSILTRVETVTYVAQECRHCDASYLQAKKTPPQPRPYAGSDWSS